MLLITVAQFVICVRRRQFGGRRLYKITRYVQGAGYVLGKGHTQAIMLCRRKALMFRKMSGATWLSGCVGRAICVRGSPLVLGIVSCDVLALFPDFTAHL